MAVIEEGMGWPGLPRARSTAVTACASISAERWTGEVPSCRVNKQRTAEMWM